MKQTFYFFCLMIAETTLTSVVRLAILDLPADFVHGLSHVATDCYPVAAQCSRVASKSLFNGRATARRKVEVPFGGCKNGMEAVEHSNSGDSLDHHADKTIHGEFKPYMGVFKMNYTLFFVEMSTLTRKETDNGLQKKV